MNKPKPTTPNPGTQEAIDQGCTCPVMDNHHGAGIPMGGETVFWHTKGCPIHCPVEED
ncbi:MAG: hypothetical protein GY861_26475 [bacterium]|nr:hypothetical protein [bacterium]